MQRREDARFFHSKKRKRLAPLKKQQKKRLNV